MKQSADRNGRDETDTTQAKARENVYFKATPFESGKAGTSGAWPHQPTITTCTRRSTHEEFGRTDWFVVGVGCVQ